MLRQRNIISLSLNICRYIYVVVEVVVFFFKYYCDPQIDTENDKFPKVQLGNEYADGHCKKNHQTDAADGNEMTH